jgi:prepilin-type N-terminal cleavage/methylation domain-containing protein
MRFGFTLIELIVAIAMSAMIALAVFQVLTQSRRAVKRITNIIEVDVPLMAFYSQVEKDVMGMFTPQSTLAHFSSEEAAENKESKQKDEKQPEKAPKKEGSYIEHVFVLEVAKENFFWSFITTAGIQVLEPDGSLSPIPYVRRVAYFLEKDAERPGTYRLMYSANGETTDLAAIKNKQVAYELLSGIKNFEIELTLYEVQEKKQEAGEKTAAQGRKPVSLKEWNETEIWSKYKTLIPAYVRLGGTVLDPAGAEHPFEILNKVVAFSPLVKKEKSLFEAIEDIARDIWGKTKASTAT